MNKGRQIVKYIVWDFFAAVAAWGVFFLFRKLSIDNNGFEGYYKALHDHNLWLGLALMPVAWVLFYSFVGTYKDVFRKSRLKELQMTLW